MQALVRTDDGFETLRKDSLKPAAEDLLETVWENGKLLRDQNLAEIRELSEKR